MTFEDIYTSVSTSDGDHVSFTLGMEFPVRDKDPNVVKNITKTMVDKASKFAGHALTKKELKEGVPRPDARNDYQRQDQQRRFRRELNPVPIDARSHEQRVYDEHAARVEAIRRKNLPQPELHLLEAKERLDAKLKADADAAAAAAIRETAGYRKTREALNDALFLAKYDAAIPVEVLELIQHESAMLETRLDVAASQQRLTQVQAVLDKTLEPQRVELQRATDALKAREAMLKVSPFDDITPEVVGNVEYLSLKVGDRVAKVSKARFDSTDHETLKGQLFPVETTNA
ncbi:hypothetical protein Pan44_23120 [Caulifigura coniformis]|uniref:Uncharacterized protein n=1 Tax=Caulifigura coniformis TaxID=2527983 RepID=A0A517SDT5_9PLAN|nr:hypothetical protein [Caulifigura coniformis]QDT54284.1 hypothetical protein Pan44_23120 [Caulifigura coniformis]